MKTIENVMRLAEQVSERETGSREESMVFRCAETLEVLAVEIGGKRYEILNVDKPGYVRVGDVVCLKATKHAMVVEAVRMSSPRILLCRWFDESLNDHCAEFSERVIEKI